MSDWRPKVKLPAKFRGVPFFVEVVEVAGGRHAEKHEYPFKETDPVFVEDTGLKGRSFPIQGFVLGPEYMAARDSLMAALEISGPGELVHPHYGTIRVQALGYRVHENGTGEGGVAKFSMEFEGTTTTAAQPASVPDSPAAVRASGGLVLSALKSEFPKLFVIAGLASAIAASLADRVVDATRQIDLLAGPLVEGAQTLAIWKQQVADLKSSATSLVGSPAVLAASFIGLLQSLVPPDPVVAVNGLLATYNFNSGVRPPATTPARIQERTCADSFRGIIQGAAVVQAAILASDGAKLFSSYEDATHVREAIVAALDEQLEVVSDTVYPLLVQLRSDLVTAVPDQSGSLPHLVSITPPATVPSLVLAHRLYGDTARELDLVARNRTRNPMFVPGGVVLEALSK